MTRFVAFLRGVNVGGVTIRMAELASVVRGLGVGEVKTVLASGNVLFTSEEDAANLRPRIEQALSAAFGYDAWVQVLAVDALASISADYPFPKREGWHRYVVFTMGDEVRAELLAVRDHLDPDQESIAPGAGAVFWTVERGNTLTTPFAKITERSKLRTLITTRNLNTVQKLL